MTVDNEVEDFLEHFGVKGMRWGVRKEEDVTSKSAQLRMKYGKDSMKDVPQAKTEEQPEYRFLSPKQKKIALAVGSAALVAGGAYLVNKSLNGVLPEDFGLPKGGMDWDLKEAQRIVGTDRGWGRGVSSHWKKGVDLEPGSIVQRLSTVKETDIRPKGFFAAFEKDDVTRYKAELPKYWKQWGYPETSGYLTQLKAEKGIKAPSAEESVEIYKKIMGRSTDGFRNIVGFGRVSGIGDSRAFGGDRDILLEAHARQNFRNFSALFCNKFDEEPLVKEYFAELRARGYNAVIDFNDAGDLAKSPIRLLNGDDFSVSGHVPVSASEIKKAQKMVGELIMSDTSDRVEAFLAHFFNKS